MGFGMTRDDVQRLAFSIAEKISDGKSKSGVV